MTDPTPERWAQLQALFEAALERDPGERAAFLAELRASLIRTLDELKMA